MAADSIVPDPYDGQSYNRFSYVMNGPLSATDPTGHDDEWLKLLGRLGCSPNPSEVGLCMYGTAGYLSTLGSLYGDEVVTVTGHRNGYNGNYFYPQCPSGTVMVYSGSNWGCTSMDGFGNSFTNVTNSNWRNLLGANGFQPVGSSAQPATIPEKTIEAARISVTNGVSQRNGQKPPSHDGDDPDYNRDLNKCRALADAGNRAAASRCYGSAERRKDLRDRGTPESGLPPLITWREAAGAAAVGTVLYWTISEGSRILFPPRNLIPVP
jgi:hypothetical protein